MTLIVDLSTTHSLDPIEEALAEYTRLCNKYSKGGCSFAYPDFFRSLSNSAWVQYQYYKNNELITSYTLGKINTLKFLKELSNIFYFLEGVKPSSDEIKEYRKYRMTEEESEKSIKENYRFFLLEKAWNKIIGLDEKTLSRLPELVKRAETEPVYLISNTNELHVSRIIQLLKIHNPEVKWNDSIDIDVKSDNKPVEIAPNIFLCLSYRYQNNKSTMSLIKSLVDSLTKKEDVNINDIQVISQYKNDLIQAQKIGIDKKNTHSDNEFFNPDELKNECIL